MTTDFREQQSAETLVRALIVAQSAHAFPAVLAMYNSTASAGSAQSVILHKDACLRAIGLALADKRLGSEAGMSEWLKSLAQELEVQGPMMMVLHRRIIWLVGQAATALSSTIKVEFIGLLFQYMQHRGASFDR